MARTRLEYAKAGAGKFWECEVRGGSLIVRWGKLGTAGQSKTKEFPDAATAKREREQVVTSKLKKGYVEVTARAEKTPSSKSSATTATKAPTKTPLKKTPVKEASPTKTRAAANSTPARSARRRETSLCFTAEQEAAVARGWPHIRTLDDQHPDDAQFQTSLRRALGTTDPHYHIVWPTRVARAYVRAVGSVKRAAEALARLPKAPPSSDVLVPDEAGEIIDRLLSPAMNYEFVVHDTVYLLEAMVGADYVADALVGAYERLPARIWKSSNPHDETYAAEALGYVLLRCSPKVQKGLRSRLVALLGSAAGGYANSDWLRLIVAGRAGAAKHHYSKRNPLRLELCHFVDDDPEHVLACAREKVNPFVIDARFVALAGPPALEAMLTSVRRMPKHRISQFVSEVAPFANEFVVGLYLLFWSKKALHPAMLSWFQTHRAFAEPLLTRARQDAEEAARITGHFAREMSAAKRAKTVANEGEAMRAVASEVLQALRSGRSAAEPEVAPEARFEALTKAVAEQLGACRGDLDREVEVLTEARERYAMIRSDVGLEPEEALVHFFAVDGCGLSKARKPAFARVKGAKNADRDRWCAALHT